MHEIRHSSIADAPPGFAPGVPARPARLDAREQILQGEPQIGKRAGLERAIFPHRHGLVPVADEGKDFHGSLVRVDGPVLTYTESRVQLALGRQIAAARAGGQDFHHQIGRRVDGSRAHDVQAFLRNEDDVGDEYVVGGEPNAIDA
jgi:hypothetical protein